MIQFKDTALSVTNSIFKLYMALTQQFNLDIRTTTIKVRTKSAQVEEIFVKPKKTKNQSGENKCVKVSHLMQMTPTSSIY